MVSTNPQRYWRGLPGNPWPSDPPSRIGSSLQSEPGTDPNDSSHTRCTWVYRLPYPLSPAGPTWNRGTVCLVISVAAMGMNRGGHNHDIVSVSRSMKRICSDHLGHYVVSVSRSMSGIRSVHRSPPWPVLLST